MVSGLYCVTLKVGGGRAIKGTLLKIYFSLNGLCRIRFTGLEEIYKIQELKKN